MAAVDIRPSPLAGQWYDDNPKSLERSVDAFLDNATLPELNDELIGVIAPHAGHRYSGAVAGHAFSAMRGRSYDLVVIASPMHHPYSQGLLTTSHRAYATPLGTVEVDQPALAALNLALERKLGMGLARVPRDPEHSLEIELPFLQRALIAPWKLLPVMVRQVEARVSEQLGHALADVVRGKSFVLVGSTDLSHFYDQKTALSLDRAMLQEIESFSPEGVFQAEQDGRGFACGLGAITAVLWAARALGADAVKILSHATSGDVTGDYTSVVGYGAAAILRSKAHA